MARILVVGKGSYGDVFPLFAIAQKLKSAGHKVTVATQQQHMLAVTSTELEWISIDTGSEAAGAAAREHSYPGVGQIRDAYRTLAPPSLLKEYDVISSAAQTSDLIVGNQLAYAGVLAAKKWHIPWVFCVASPLAIPSYQDPPLFPYLHQIQRIARHHQVAQSGLMHLARYASRLAMHHHTRLQKQLNVHDGMHPRFEGIYSNLLNLITVSKTLLAPRSDWPPHTVVTGFNWFDPIFMRNEQELHRIMAFVERGEAPIVIAPSGMQRVRPGIFFQESLAACKLLGRRAIVIASNRFHKQIKETSNVLVSGYMPYSDVLCRAAAMIHCGGIGTIGWNLRFALPSLVVPFEWDQFDNADRAQRHNFALVIERKNFRATKIAEALNRLLQSARIKEALTDASHTVAIEDGAAVAHAEIENLLTRLSK